MRTYRRYILLTFCFFILHIGFAQYHTFTFDGLQRTYLLRLPPSYDDAQIYPLVIAMHGGFGNAFNMERQSQLTEKAAESNFIVVYPEGVKGGVLGISTWNAGYCCGYASRTDIDDVGFIEAVLDQLTQTLAIDTTRIYATGMSNGGFMSYRLACELSHKIAAIAPVAASMSMDYCSPERPVPIISIHSYSDDHVPYEGGRGNGFSPHHNENQDSILSYWAKYNQTTEFEETNSNHQGYIVKRWFNGQCGSEVVQYITDDGGHSWPGGQGTRIGDQPSTVIIANDVLWTFFQQYTLDCVGELGVDAKNKIIQENRKKRPIDVQQKVNLKVVRSGNKP